jgi:hypothetical protein
MKIVLKLVSFIGLSLTIAPSLLVYFGTIDIALHKTLMLIGTLLWFFTAPFWLGRQQQQTGQTG